MQNLEFHSRRRETIRFAVASGNQMIVHKILFHLKNNEFADR